MYIFFININNTLLYICHTILCTVCVARMVEKEGGFVRHKNKRLVTSVSNKSIKTLNRVTLKLRILVLKNETCAMTMAVFVLKDALSLRTNLDKNIRCSSGYLSLV